MDTNKDPTTEAAAHKRHGVRHDTGPTVAVCSGDMRAAWNGGAFAGDRELVRWARNMAAARVPVTVFDVELTAGDDTPEGALAAMASWNPGRSIVTEAPDSLLDMLVAGRGHADQPVDGGQ